MSVSNPPPPLKLVVGLGVAIVLAILFVVIVAPPLIHPFVYAFIVRWPGWILLGLALAGGLLVWVGGAMHKTGAVGLGALMVVVFGVLFLFYGIVADSWAKQAFLERNEIASLEEEPETVGVRYTPRSIAEKAMSQYNTDPRVVVEDIQALVEGDDARWIASRKPNNFSETWFGSQPGAMLINSATEVEVVADEFNPGYGLSPFWDSLGWNAVQERFWGDYSPEDYPYILDGELVIIKPYMDWGMSWEKVFPVMVPELDGVQIWRSDGSVEDLSVAEASEKYPEGRFVPHEYAEYFADAYQYKDGLWNAWFYHIDQPDVPHIEGSDNQFPFLLPSSEGPEWYTAVEPYGSARGVYKSYHVDATSGEIGVTDFSDTLLGPDKAVDWAAESYQEFKNLSFIEPRPVVKNGELYWMLSGTTDRSVDVSFTVLVSAAERTVHQFDNKSDLDSFLQGGPLPRAEAGAGGAVPEASSAPAPTGGDSGASSESSDLPQRLRDLADELEQQQGG